jgi:hypothetical protein
MEEWVVGCYDARPRDEHFPTLESGSAPAGPDIGPHPGEVQPLEMV